MKLLAVDKKKQNKAQFEALFNVYNEITYRFWQP
jgi:hypothetical protein